MEQKFYLFPGQTLENTKVEDRGQGLHVTEKEWNRILKHLDRKKDILEALEKEENKRRYLDEGSKNMIKNWDNSLENIRKRKEEARLNHIESIKEDRMRRFFQMRDEQAELRKQYVEKVKKQMFMDTGWARDVNSAFVLSEVVYEREKQKDFKKFIQEHEVNVEAKYAKVVKENAKNEADEKAEVVKENFEKRKEYGKYLRKIIGENEQKAQTEEATRIQKESIDNAKSIKEMEFIKKMEREQKLLEKMEMKKDKEKHLKSIEDYKKQLQQEEKEMDDVIAIYQNAKHQIDCMRIEKEAEKQEAMIKRREVVAKIVAAGETAKAETEEKCLKAALEEREAMLLAKIKEREEYDAKMRQERLDDRNRFLERRKEEERKEAEMQKWEMVNRYKIGEFTKQYELDKKKELWQSILRRRKELMEQMEEDERRRMEEKRIDDCLSKVSFEEDDEKFFDYADEVLQLTKKKGRPTYPIEKIILAYKKFNSLMPPLKKCTTCEDYRVEEIKSDSRDLVKKSFKKKTCKCNRPK